MAELSILKQPIALRQEHIASSTTKLRVQSTSRVGGEYEIFSTGTPEGTSSSSATPESQSLFKIDGNAVSWRQQRYFRDASGLPLFELHRKAAGVTWFVDVPGRNSKQPLATLAPQFHMLKDKCDVHFSNAAANDEETVLAVRGQDVWKKWTHVYIGDHTLVMRVKLIDMLAVYVPTKRRSWEMEIAEGMDMSLVSEVLSVTLFMLIYGVDTDNHISHRLRLLQFIWLRTCMSRAIRLHIHPMDLRKPQETTIDLAEK